MATASDDFFTPPVDGGAAQHFAHPIAHRLQGRFAATIQDDQKLIFAPPADEIGGPHGVPQGSRQGAENGGGGILPVAGAELAEFPRLDAQHAEGNVKFGKGAEGFAQVRLHHDVIGQSGDVIEESRDLHGFLAGIGVVGGPRLFEGVNGPDDRAVLVAQGDSAGVNGDAMSGLVLDENTGFHGFAFMQGRDGERTLLHALIATVLIALRHDALDAGMPQHFHPGAGGDQLGAVVPEDYFFLQIHHANTDAQAFQNAAVDLGISNQRHGARGNPLDWLVHRQREGPTSHTGKSGKLCDFMRFWMQSLCCQRFGGWHFRVWLWHGRAICKEMA